MSFKNGQLIPLTNLRTLNGYVLQLEKQLNASVEEGSSLTVNKTTLQGIVNTWKIITSLDASDTNNIEDELANIEKFLGIKQ